MAAFFCNKANHIICHTNTSSSPSQPRKNAPAFVFCSHGAKQCSHEDFSFFFGGIQVGVPAPIYAVRVDLKVKRVNFNTYPELILDWEMGVWENHKKKKNANKDPF